MRLQLATRNIRKMNESLSEDRCGKERDIIKILAYSHNNVQLVYWRVTVILYCGGGVYEE
jgi:hypothetical protein